MEKIKKIQVYANSEVNANIIVSLGHKVHYGVDATKLKETLLTTNDTNPCTTTTTNDTTQSNPQQQQQQQQQLESNWMQFDCIQFNFPHWRGKSNIARNRELLQDFFLSASQILYHDDDDDEYNPCRSSWRTGWDAFSNNVTMEAKLDTICISCTICQSSIMECSRICGMNNIVVF
jgi:Domain of unknown function (DUF2431)